MGKQKLIRILIFGLISIVISIQYTNCSAQKDVDIFASLDPCKDENCSTNIDGTEGGIYNPQQGVQSIEGTIPIQSCFDASGNKLAACNRLKKIEFSGACNPSDSEKNEIHITVTDPKTGCKQPLYPPSSCVDGNCFTKKDYRCESGRYTILVPTYSNYDPALVQRTRLILKARMVGKNPQKSGTTTTYVIDSKYEGKFREMEIPFDIRGPSLTADMVGQTIPGLTTGTFSVLCPQN